ncbi:gibberellin 3-beta-dioxygenase 1-like [Silene latifolia]|uniref:gibberellin 3-beta-dioxygenase 1-like n=1 Tax=Silene latifolia TaxID=37657 RepID=UPI003D77901F
MGILTEAYKQHPVENKFITPIDFASIKDIPESHAWVETSPRKIYKNSTNNNNNNKTNEELTSIPVIELNNPYVVDQIFQACENWGMFQIINHGILGQTLEKVELEAKKLFNLPIEEKMKVLRSPDGATGYGSPRITPFFSKLMWCEGFTIIGNSLVDHAMQLWPNDYQGFCDVMEKYEAQLKLLADKLMGFMLKSLNIPKSEMNWVKQDPNNISTALQLNSYPSCPDPTRTMGLAEHTDTFLFTILHQTGNASGLQVYKDGLGWVSVDPVPGALVVNVGDLLHIISNGRFPSVVHRAVVNNEKQRMSMAYFYGPPLDYIVAPFVGYSGCESPCFESMTVKEYVSIKSKLLDSALSSITK